MTPKDNKKAPILDKIAFGWGKLEPAILGWVAGSLPFIVKGIHGNCKTTVMKIMSLSMADPNAEDKGNRFVPCDKASIITLAGMPSKELMEKHGDLQFIPSKSTLIGKAVKGVTLDELTRAPKETGNFLLEVVENKTLFGIELHYEFLAATMNPETYKGAIKLDAALLDRFVGTLPIDDLAEVDSGAIESMISINQLRITDKDYDANIAKEIKDRLALVKIQYVKLIQNEDTMNRVRAYVGQFGAFAQPKLRSSDQQLLSGRELGNLIWRSILSISAYYIAIYNWSEGQALIRAAEDTINYAVILKHQLLEQVAPQLLSIHNDIQYILSATSTGVGGKLFLSFAKAQTGQQKVEFWRQNIDAVIKEIPEGDSFPMMESTVTKIEEMVKDKKIKADDILRTKSELYSIANGHKIFQPVMDRIEGGMICELIHMLRDNSINPILEPYKTVFSKPTLQASEIIDLITHMQTGKISANTI